MTFEQTINYLYNTLPMFSRMGSAAFKKDLINIRLLATLLDHPENAFRSIHVGGTNGKGSVSHMLAAILQTAGYKTGLYTSPHLYDFRERIRMNGQMIEKEFVVDFVRKIKPSIDRIQPSFFEITVAMAFHYFAKQQADIAVIEVGLGGRLDSTNIIRPELSVITNIGWDHMNILGDSLEAIAIEKAGIIKDQVPVVVGENNKATDGVFRKVAREKNAPLYFATEHFTANPVSWEDDSFTIAVSGKNKSTRHLRTDLLGIYQARNLATVLQSVAMLREKGFRIPEDAVLEGLKNVKRKTGLQGRWDAIRNHPAVVLEVAHNREGISEMLRHLQAMAFRQLHLVLGVVKDKDAQPVLEQLPKNALYYFTQAQIPRAMEAGSLQQQAAAFALQGNVYGDVNEALLDAIARAATDDLIVVCGSIFLAAEVDREKIRNLSVRQGAAGRT